jgi:hypothetical protein
MRAFNAMCANWCSKGIGEDAVATGAYPKRKYSQPKSGRIITPVAKTENES